MCCNVFDYRIRKTAQLRRNWITGEMFGVMRSLQRSGEIGFFEKGEKGHQKQSPRAAWAGMTKFKNVRIRCSNAVVMGCY